MAASLYGDAYFQGSEKSGRTIPNPNNQSCRSRLERDLLLSTQGHCRGLQRLIRSCSLRQPDQRLVQDLALVVEL